ncbi:branched-chain amino acid ABC transporter permease [Christensenellaceae bacterium OttesenSCG-928-K19]|nr:branched-chain amino acid ABC transporter permease [Christensenellaceae bacterium OttesenSCG-928-K19]
METGNAIKSGNASKAKWLIFVAIIAALILLPFYASEYGVMIFLLIMLYMALGQMWNLLGGYAGLVSLGQQIFIGIGAYAVAMITVVAGLHFVVGIILGGVISALFAWLISKPIFKMSGVYFTIGTWIVAQTLALIFSNLEFFRYAQGFNITVTYTMTQAQIYYMALACGVGAVVLVFVLLRSKLGLALMAIRDNPSAAEAMGVEVYKTKLKCFLISGFATGMIGAVFYMYLTYVTPFAVFSIDWTVAMTFLVIIGGMGTMEGPIVGAVIYVILRQYLYNFPGISMVILGAVAIIIIIVAPKGIMGSLQSKFGFEILSPRRKLSHFSKEMSK